MADYTIHILQLYPDLLDLYGDKGNLASLSHRLTWRGIQVETSICTQQDALPDLETVDILYLGGGSDRDQEIVCQLLEEKKEALSQYIQQDGVLLATCGGFQMLGIDYAISDGTAKGLGLLNLTATDDRERHIGNIFLSSPLCQAPVCGFENHVGQTNIGNYTPLGTVTYGYGNDGNGAEGLIYKNVFATNLHGPLLPKNPQLCDVILTRALKKKYPDFDALPPLDDRLETEANQQIFNRFSKA